MNDSHQARHWRGCILVDIHLTCDEWIVVLTVTGNRRGLKDTEAILGLERRDLSMRELGKELWLFVVLEVDVVLWQIDLQAGESGSSTNLQRTVKSLSFST